MLLNLSLGLIIDPSAYPSTLAVRLETDNRSDCGVRSGRHEGFKDEAEMDQPMPRVVVPDDKQGYGLSDIGIFDYIIDRPAKLARAQQALRYSYVVTGHNNGVYYDCPDVHVLVLIETQDDWHVAFGRPRDTQGFRLILPDYEPGWFARTGTKAL